MFEANEDLSPARLLDPEPRTNRRLITVLQWSRRPDELIESCAYWFNSAAEEFGLDPWRVVDGVDPHVTGDQFDVWFAGGGSITVTGDHQIYVSLKTFSAMGIRDTDPIPSVS